MAMLSIDTSCPHCLKDNAVLSFISESPLDERQYSLVFQCQSCFRLLVAEVETDLYQGPFYQAEQSIYPVVVNHDQNYTLLNIYPELEAINAPANTPERASKFFIEAKEDFSRGRYETSAINCRKVIDIASKHLHLGSEDKLVRRISALREQGLITPEMADWAHIVRIDTNGAVHSDEEFTRNEVEQLLNFTEVFLIYAFTLPAMVRENRENS